MRDGEQLDTQTPPIAVAVSRQPRLSGRVFARAFMWLLPLFVLAVTLFIWLSSGRFITTDNAYVKGDRAQIATELSGIIVEVPVKENQAVSRGQLLFRL
ncbi:MAG: biotin/lipoyl-binding protein, partial [Reyranella sp.]|nr:biotin/lipoyl-binding protein [Reyranella sp.]